MLIIIGNRPGHVIRMRALKQGSTSNIINGNVIKTIGLL
jgi:hypothetical protein